MYLSAALAAHPRKQNIRTDGPLTSHIADWSEERVSSDTEELVAYNGDRGLA